MITIYDDGRYGLRTKEGPLKGPECANCYQKHGKILEALDDYDWGYAFDYAMFDREDVAEIIAMSEGEHDEKDWLLLCKLNNGQFGGLSAGCDYTGWD